MLRFELVRALVCVGAASLLATTAYTADSAASSTVNPVIQWNRNLLTIVRTAGAQPASIHPTRSFAIMHAAIYDAVNSIDPDHRPYRVLIEHVSPHASQDAAAAEAAHDVLVDLYPTFQGSLDAQLQQSLQEIPDGIAKTEGTDVGRAVAAAIVALRTDDGSAATPPAFVFDNIPGHYQSTPPNFPKPVFTHWPQVETFVLARADQFRSAAPPTLTSQEYTDVFNEVKAVGIANSTVATPDEALTGRFWNGAIQNYWNEIAQTAATTTELNTQQSARLFALLNLSLADAVIAFYDSKYTYRFWRPVTAIRAAASAANPQTIADPNWLPEVGNTAPDPSYPGAHAVISAAAASVLREFFGKDAFHFVVTSEVMPGTTRTFDSFGAAEQEASLSRIFAGVHFRSDEDAGVTQGALVADFVFDHELEAVPRDERDRP
jgi:membrane-associated phospholipid phosphatase